MKKNWKTALFGVLFAGASIVAQVSTGRVQAIAQLVAAFTGGGGLLAAKDSTTKDATVTLNTASGPGVNVKT